MSVCEARKLCVSRHIYMLVLKARAFTCACELLGRRGEQQLVGHVTRPGTAGDARLLVAALHPVGQPLHVAVAVQRVGPQSAATHEGSNQCSL